MTRAPSSASKPSTLPMVRGSTDLASIEHPRQLEPLARALSDSFRASFRQHPPEVPREPETKDFYLYGVIGAKNVGKSSLVAALLGVTHEAEEGRELGEGTRRPKIYASAKLGPKVRELFQRVGVESELAFRAGAAEGFEKVAFLDLPDIESRFEDHLPLVQAISPWIDGLIIVRTAESSLDAVFLEKLKAFRRPQMDLFLVMNKFDDWVHARGGDLAEARAVCCEHLAEVLKGLELSQEEVYCTDSRPADLREQEGFDLPRLIGRVLADKSSQELARAKHRAWVFSYAHWALALRHDQGIDAARSQLEDLQSRCQDALGALEDQPPEVALQGLLDPAILEAFQRHLERSFVHSGALDREEGRLIRRVFFRRAEALPGARIFAAPFYALGELADAVLQLVPTRGSERVLKKEEGREAEEALEAVTEALNRRFEASRRSLDRLLEGIPEVAVASSDEARRSFSQVLYDASRRRESEVLAEVQRPSVLVRASMALPLVWFLLVRPLVQVTVGVDGSLRLGRILLALPRLLRNFADPMDLVFFLAATSLFYLLVLLREYHQAFRAVKQHLDREDHARVQAQRLSREFFRSLFEDRVLARFRRPTMLLQEASEQLEMLEESLQGLDPEATGDARRDWEEWERMGRPESLPGEPK